MRSGTGTFQQTPDSGRFLSSDELALPAVCGQTGKPFLMIVRRWGSGILELVRAITIRFADSANGGPVRSTDRASCAIAPGPRRASLNGGTNEGTAAHPSPSFRELKMRAEIDIGSGYDGCPYCRASGYFHCSNCEMFSCWASYNERQHLDHTDVWCQGCRSWRCTADKDDGDRSSEVIGFALWKGQAELQNSLSDGSTNARHVKRESSIRGYLG